MDSMRTYIDHIAMLMERLWDTQKEVIAQTAERIVNVALSGGKIFIFGCTHAGILAQEAFYRTGGLVIMNPILPPGLTCDVVPITMTSQLERQEKYGRIILDSTRIQKGDLLLIHSVSGRNGVPVEMAIAAEERGISTVCITNMEYSRQSTSRHSSGKRLFEVCSLTIDNCGCFGDAAIEVEGFAGKVAPTSTVIGATIINSICVEVTALFVEKGIDPPVFLSANVDGGDAYNDRIMEQYKDQITYC